MKEFKFSAKRNVRFLIEGKEYAAGIGEVKDAIGKMTGILTKAGRGDDDAFDEAFGVIDEMFGKGSAKEIFAGRKRDVFDMIDLATYIAQEFTEQVSQMA